MHPSPRRTKLPAPRDSHPEPIQVHCGDCRDLVPTLGEFDFIFADPPFNIGQPYRGYQDRRVDYGAFTREWITTCWNACRGVLALHGPDGLVGSYLAVAAELGMPRIDWIVWHYRFGQYRPSRFTDAKAHCLVFARARPHTWNPEAILVASDRLRDRDPRVREAPRQGLRVPGNVWGVPSDGPHWGRVPGNSHERRPGHPNQLPEVYLERLLRAYTNPGDRVLDPFAGSGTTAVVAQALGRRCVAIEISPWNVTSLEGRLARGAVRVRATGPAR